MSTTPELHKAQSAHRFHVEYGEKYDRGQTQHGGNLGKKGLLFHAKACREEALDQIAYTDGIMQAVQEIHRTVLGALGPNIPDCALRAYLHDIKRLLEGTDTSGS